MAEDHRYSWLDDSAAERLLRGEPVGGQPGAPDGRGDESYAEAERLAAVLSAVAGAGRPAAPSDASALPGEEAAMAAFRAARVEVEAAAEVVVEPGVARRAHRIRQFRERQPWLRRPLRAGMIAMVAGCALSGFAVAAAAGVLPTPFGTTHHTPGPSVSMSDAGPGGESAHPEISEDGGTTAPGPSGSSDNDASDVGSNGAQGGTVPSDPADEDKGKDGKKDPSSKGKHGTPGWALRICPRYLAAELGGADLDKKSLKKLTNAAGSASAIHGYCTQILADDSTGTPRSGDSTDNGGGDNGTDTGSDNGGNGGNGDNGGNGGDGNGGSDGSGSGSGDSGGTGGGGDSGGDSGKDGGDDTTVPQPPPPPGDTTGTPTATTTPTPASDSTASTDPVTATETGAD
ncbi:hypothetical protein [Streptomyces violaceusniger]|uniref:Extensin n=1 Tax=Streptomyces violaceusniger (strain Tu 4113) TaxID=653045 RepID=G2P1G9_STRV4|nr:hypothetical protein [Streptomyces violaceusniger]AEM87918.1 hypothetical protein Strvi_8610 [Streptomyces violaceusniger Tu 4113]